MTGLKLGAVMSYGMPVAHSDGVAVDYERAPPADVETVVFVEGWSYGRWMWRWQRAALADDYDTILYDNRGTGASASPGLGMSGLLGKLPERARQLLVYAVHRDKYTIPTMASDLEAVLAAAGVEEAHVVGASMGGMIAQQYAITYDRAASLTLMCTTAGGDMENLIPEETMEHLERVPGGLDEREEVTYRMEPATTGAWREANADLIDDIVDWRLAQDASPQARDAQAMGQLGWDVRDAIESVDVPALVVHGDADEVVPLERGEVVADRLPDARFEVVEGGPHLFFIEQADAVNEHLREFLADV
jgi:pimeloyl-ACP methyl ester carboxylesterase